MTESTAEEPVQDRGAPPGFMDRPDVKEAVAWALAQVAKKEPRRPGLPIDQIAKMADEQRRELDPPA